MEKIKYPNEEITILWQPQLCIHAAVCLKTLPNVYDPKKRPWIQIRNATTKELMEQVSKCPSGALSILENSEDTSYNSKR